LPDEKPNARELYLQNVLKSLAEGGYSYLSTRRRYLAHVIRREDGEVMIWDGVPSQIVRMMEGMEATRGMNGKDRLKDAHKEQYDRILDEIQATIILLGGRKFKPEELERMSVEQLLAMLIPNGVEVIVHPDPTNFRKPRRTPNG